VSGHSTHGMSLLSAEGNCMSQLQKIGWYTAIQWRQLSKLLKQLLMTLAGCRLSLNTGRLFIHNLYLSHLVEIADGSCHALAINSRICAAFCVLPVYYQLLAVEYR